MVLGKLPVPGRPTILITVGQGPTALAGQVDCKSGISYMSVRRQTDSALAKRFIELDAVDGKLFHLRLPLSGRRPDID